MILRPRRCETYLVIKVVLLDKNKKMFIRINAIFYFLSDEIFALILIARWAKVKTSIFIYFFLHYIIHKWLTENIEMCEIQITVTS